MRDASSGYASRATSDFISFEVDESFDVTQKTVYLLAVLSSSLRQTRESPKRISVLERKKASKKEAKYRLMSRFYRKQIISC